MGKVKRSNDSQAKSKVKQKKISRPKAVYNSKLRKVVKKDKMCAKLFREAEDLAKSIFEGEQYISLPFYTEHDEEHCKALESFLDQIIWKNGESKLYVKHDFIPSPEEAMYLLSAIWLHDLGMWYGILDNEKPEHLNNAEKVISLRDKHEVRASRYIQEKWIKPKCNWKPQEKDWLSNICVYHRKHHPMNTFEPIKGNGLRIENKQIRLSVLAALLRLVDACHVDKRRAPQGVMGLYISLGMPKEARVHWDKADMIKDVRFNHDSRKIELIGHYPRTFEYGLGKFDVQEVGQMICDNVLDELRSVQQTLSHFSNIDFGGVLHIPSLIRAKDYEQKQQCLHLWPYFMSRPFSATEAAAALAQMLLLSVEQAKESDGFGKVWRKDIRQIMKNTKDLRQQDFMIRNLCIEVENRLSVLVEDEKSAIDLIEYLTAFMESIKDNCNKLVDHALKEIDPGDVLVLYGYSTNIDNCLKRLEKNHKIYIIDCYKPLDGNKGLYENKEVLRSLKDSGFGGKYIFIQLESLSAALDELRRKKIVCKVLLGTHGRLKNGDLLCKVGSRIIVATAKKFGAEVIAFCETTKFLSVANNIKDYQIAGHEQLFSSDDEKKHPELIGEPYVASQKDRVPKSFVDVIITEQGVERRRKPVKQGAGARKGRSKGRKASKAK